MPLNSVPAIVPEPEPNLSVSTPNFWSMVTKSFAERGVVPEVAGDVLPVAVPAAGEEDRQVAGAVAAGVAEVAADEHLRLIEQTSAALFGVAER